MVILLFSITDFYLILYDEDPNGTQSCETIDYYSLLSLKSFKLIKKLSPKVLLPVSRGGLYMWEGKDIEFSTYQKGCTIDYIHLYSLLKYRIEE